ncbi:hypothetical protein EGH21_20235 [Halomicroarcula sp. F13]|uniref:Flp pilus-assembly TadG-like N-terminal domain-containing protein n=1 Tax=Haloarcula rubra TaxID=2487747 RepID=A0AAW4PXH4_9EURY|nr:hypothetical protein [Halomicroarcula rubra]MBX0325359.1 hypothetical protein [Halomicroarcula rubra]
MVDLMRRERGDRGQVLLVTTFGIAVLFVVLALALNASAYSQTMVASHDADGGDAVAFADAAAEGADGTLAYVNRHNDTSYTTLQTELDEGVADWSEQADGYAARRGARATVSVTGTTEGTRILQANATRPMTNVSGADNWTLASGVSGTRDARLNVSESALVASPDDTNATTLHEDRVFHLDVADGADVWRLFVYREGGDVVVRVQDTSGSLLPACSVSAGADGYAVVDLSNGSVEGTDCPQVAGFDAVGSSYDVAYYWGSNAAGNYSMIVDRSRPFVDDSDYGTAGSGDPHVTERIYSVSIRVTYETPTTEYVTETTVLAGDADA